MTAASSFDTDDDGWRITGDAQGSGTAPDYLESGGNPGGHICADDNVAGGTWYFSAPAGFLGDQVGAYGGTLAFDIKQSSTDEQFAQDDIVLRNGTRTIVYDFGNTTAHPGTSWTGYSVPLDATNPGWTYDSGGDVSPAAFRTLLGNLTSLSIRGEYVSGSDRGCLDNVRLTESTSAGTFEVTVDATNSPVTEGETLTVDATVRNNGTETATQDVALSVGGVETDSSQVSLQPGQRRTVSLSWTTSPGDAGNYGVNVSSASDRDSTAVTVQEQGTAGTFDVTVDATNSPVTEGETLTVDATVRNNGTETTTQRVVGVIGAFENDSVEVSLDPGQQQTVSLSWATSVGDAGNYGVNVLTASDSDSTAVTVEEQGASVTVDDQQVADVSVQEIVVGSASLPSPGFLVVYNASVGTSPAPSSAIGVSGLLGPGGHENVRVDLDERIAGSQTLTVVVHSDTDGDNIFDGGEIDTPVTVNGVPVNDTASITIRSPTGPSTATSTPVTTPTPATTSTEGTSGPKTTGGGGPGFGVGTTVLALVTALLLARRD